jgi:hypothetical protein
MDDLDMPDYEEPEKNSPKIPSTNADFPPSQIVPSS